MRAGGNRSKLDAAKTLLRVVAPVFSGKKKVFTLVDSWYMKYPFLSYVLESGIHAIGQVRRDSALYDIPVVTGKRGRPRKYGKKFTPELVATVPQYRRRVFLYGKWQRVRYRSVVCLARFLRGRKVRVVWMQFEDESGSLSKQRLILSTKCGLDAIQIMSYYARRWSIEDLFNQMKNRWGWREAWQQSRQVLHRWTQILSVAYALPQLLATYCGDQLEDFMQLTPWRKKKEVTAGRVRLGLRMILGHVRVRDWWNPTCRKFQPDFQAQPEPNTGFTAVEQHYMMSKNNLTENIPPPT